MATIKYWNGSAWELAIVGKQGPAGPTGPTGPAGSASLQRFRFVATGGETSLSGTDANGNTLAYTAGLEEVFLNGSALIRGQDYVATTGSSITSLAALTATDVVEILAWGVFNVSNTISNTLIDAKGDILAGSAADTVSRLAVGADNTVLTADSTTATGLKWATPASGSETLLSTTSLSGTATTISSISGAYKHLRIWIYDLDITTATAAQIRFNFNSDLGNHYSGVVGSIPGTILDKSSDIGYVTPDRNLSTAATDSSIILDVYHYANTDTHKPFISKGIYWDGTAGTLGGVLTFGGYASTSAITSIRIFSSSAQAFTGTVKIYGVN